MAAEPKRTCPQCGAGEEEISTEGHRRLPDGRLCPEGCDCQPQHFSRQEHRAALGDVETFGWGPFGPVRRQR